MVGLSQAREIFKDISVGMRDHVCVCVCVCVCERERERENDGAKEERFVALISSTGRISFLQ